MKIVVDAGCLGITDNRLKVGVYTVVKNLLLELSILDKKNEYLLYSFHPIDQGLMKKLGKNMKNIIVKPTKGWFKIAVPLRLSLDQPDILLAANQALPMKLPFTHYKTLSIIYDIAFKKHPEWYPGTAKKHQLQTKDVTEKSDVIIAISKHTKKDAEHVYHVPSSKILVSYLGIEKKRTSKQYVHTVPYFLFVGALKKSKNIPLLLRSFVRFLRNTHKEYDLLLVGGDKWIDPDIKHVMDTIPENYKKHIHLLGFVSDTQLASLYKGAFAFVSPSLSEGFGLPFLEAQQQGIPVLAGRAGALPEILNNSALLVNPKNINHLTAAMTKLTLNRELYKKLTILGRENAQRYSWKLFAKKVQSGIERLG